MILFQDDGAQSLPAALAGLMAETAKDLSGGVTGSFAILGMKGSRFQIKYQGKVLPILNEKQEPVGSVELVIVKANDYLTKQFYAKGYVEGDSSPPDCFSLDGKKPAASVQHPQHSNCAACPKNAFTKINEQTGKATKWCADTRKLAVVPVEDIKNEMMGGPMLMRVTASGLKDLALFGSSLQSRGYPYNAVAVRISFDLTVSYPKPVFKAIRVLTEEEAQQVLEWYQSDAVAKLLADFDEDAEATPVGADTVFEVPPAAPAPVPRQAPPPVSRPVAPPPPAAAAAPAGVIFGKPKVAAPAPVASQSAPTEAVAPKAPPARKKAATVPAAPPAAQMTLEEGIAAAQAGEDAAPPSGLENDIAGILAELDNLAE
jgi:hypothetical protein